MSDDSKDKKRSKDESGASLSDGLNEEEITVLERLPNMNTVSPADPENSITTRLGDDSQAEELSAVSHRLKVIEQRVKRPENYLDRLIEALSQFGSLLAQIGKSLLNLFRR